MDPLTAAILVSAITGGAGFMQARNQRQAAESAQRQQAKQAVQNQNALVEENFNKRKAALARGLGGTTEGPLGIGASQTGAVLTSVTGEASNNILG